MIRRLVYIGLGAAIGAYAVHRVTRLTRRWKPQGLADAVGQAREAVQDFTAEVRVAAAEREAELREAFGLTPDGHADDTTEHTVKEHH